MRRLLTGVFFWMFAAFGLRAQERSEAVAVELELEGASFFTDLVVNAMARFPEAVDEPADLPGAESGVSILGVEILEGTSPGDAAAFALIRLLPRQAGLVTIPAIEFTSEKNTYRTAPKQIFVGAPAATDAMTFTMVPAKSTVYAGEPLRIDVTWTADFPADRVRSLRCFPDAFSWPGAEVVVPRCTAPEDEQMGLPFGGRRIIARRTRLEEKSGALGTVKFPIFVRFTEPGKVDLPAARLEIALLKGKGGPFAPYAAFFNNGLFEPLTELEPFDRFFVEAPPMSLTVASLPEEGRTDSFSGLFAPCSIETSLNSSEIDVGDIVEVNLRVRSQAPEGMLDLPPLGVQRSLRGRFRAGDEYGRVWQEDGAGFLGRIRALTTDISALPALRFQVFDPVAGEYRFLQTKARPLTVNPVDGRRFFDIRSLVPETTFTDQPEGVWHNAKPGQMREILNLTTGLFAEHLWVLLLLGPAAFLLALPRVRESRRRATDPAYRARAEAFEAFRRLPEHGGKKWTAFRRFLATGFSMPGAAWTPGDTARLRRAGVADEDVERIREIHDRIDAADFSSRKPPCEIPELEALARRLSAHFRKNLPVILAGLFLLPGLLRASDWDEAESLFAEAIAATPGEPETESLFTQAALRFEAATGDRKRTGAAWSNAGNAWFKAGEIGRAISCYRQARMYRPFDKAVSHSLDAARALCVDVVEDRRGFAPGAIPVRWLAAGLVLASWGFWGLLLAHLRYRTRLSLGIAAASLAAVAGIAATAAFAAGRSGRDGVVVAGSIYGRKGPAYRYEQTFREPLHDGLEFRILDERDEWLLVALDDDRRCWIPADQARRIRNGRR